MSPFEIEVIVSSSTPQGITVLIQSTSITQIHAIFVSFIAYDPSILNMVSGSYTYDQYQPMRYLQFTPPISVSTNSLAMHGFNSFIMRNGQFHFMIMAELVNSQLSFTSSTELFYLGYSYFFLVGGPCGQCPGYNIYFNNRCMTACPPNSYYNGQTCIVCKSH